MMRVIAISCFTLSMVTVSAAGAGADDQSNDEVRKKLESEYQITSVMADKSDIAKAGTQVELQKDQLFMLDATSPANPCMNSYRAGRIAPDKACGLTSAISRGPFGKFIPHADSAPRTRNFVRGEKLWVTQIYVRATRKGQAIHLEFFSDAIDNVRYSAPLEIPAGNVTASADDALKLVGEVIARVPPADTSDTKADAVPPANAAGAPQEAPPAALIAPPPPEKEPKN